MKLDNRLWFCALCVFWGGMWLAVKMSVTEAPAMAVACVRAIVSGVLMLAISGVGPAREAIARAGVRVLVVAMLTTTLGFATVFWGTARLSTGVSAIANNATMPIGLLVFGVLLREETASRRQVLGIAVGIAGLCLLFARRTGGRLDLDAVAGLVAVVTSALCYGLGSVLARPLLRTTPALTVGALQMLIGGVGLVPIVALVERPTLAELATLGAPTPLFGIAWMVLAGGVGATFIYLRLIRDWGPTRTSMYAFVTPIIATVLGAIVLDERMGAIELAGAAVMLAGAALVLPVRTAAVEPAAPARIVPASRP
jgi:drug/metabolite transporter (DMT)-like permease